MKRLDLIGARLGQAYRSAQRRSAVETEARQRRIPQRCVTPASNEWGRFYVLLLGTGRRPNTILLAAADPQAPAVEVELEECSTDYRRLAPLHDLSLLLTQVEQDYPPATLPAAACRAVDTAVLTWVKRLAPARHGDVDSIVLANTLSEPLRPFLHIDCKAGSPEELSAACALLDQRSTQPGWGADVRKVIEALHALLEQVLKARVSHTAVRGRALDEALATALQDLHLIVHPHSERYLLDHADSPHHGDEELLPMPYRRRDA